jgi:hypothetical protein
MQADLIVPIDVESLCLPLGETNRMLKYGSSWNPTFRTDTGLCLVIICSGELQIL